MSRGPRVYDRKITFPVTSTQDDVIRRAAGPGRGAMTSFVRKAVLKEALIANRSD
jgi:uncharacterized protein (DUF1778 family)